MEEGQPCCGRNGGWCYFTDLACAPGDSNECRKCGGDGEPCCVDPNNRCPDAEICWGGNYCMLCGEPGQPCCDGNQCDPGVTCTNDEFCEVTCAMPVPTRGTPIEDAFPTNPLGLDVHNCTDGGDELLPIPPTNAIGVELVSILESDLLGFDGSGYPIFQRPPVELDVSTGSICNTGRLHGYSYRTVCANGEYSLPTPFYWHLDNNIPEEQ